MSEQGPPTTHTDEPDGSKTERSSAADEAGSLRRQVADEVSRRFPGISPDGVLAQAVGITGDLAGAEDVRQSLYAGLLCLSEARRAKIRSLDAYVYVSVRNLALRWRKTHRPPHHVCLEAEHYEKETGDFTETVADEDEINFMLSQLPGDCQEGFVYYFAEDCTAEEVAARLGIRTEAFKKRLQRAMLKLAQARIAYAKRLK